MPDKTLEQLLDPDVLTERYVQLGQGHNFPLTQAFFANPRQVRSSEFSFLYYPAMSEPAPMNVRGGAAHVLTAGGATRKFASCYHLFNKIPVDGDAVVAIRNPDNRELQSRGIESVSQVFDDFGLRHQIAKELILAKSLTAGVVYLNPAGAVLESSSGASVTVDLNVAATHKGNLDGKISALWSEASTKIAGQLETIVRAAVRANVERPTDIWVNAVNKAYLRDNTEFKTWAQYNNRATDVVLQGDIIENLWGFRWHFLSGAYTAPDGSVKDYLPASIAVITPPPDSGWRRATNGLTLVPRTVGVAPDWRAALNSLDEKFGAYSYAEVSHNPTLMHLYMGDVFGFHYAEPGAIWIATAFPS